MISVSETDIVKIAIEICNNSEFKKKILFIPDSDVKESCLRKKKWDDEVEKEALVLLETYGLEKQQVENVIGVVFSIAMRMLCWVEYYAGTYGLSRDFCVGFLGTDLFTPKGIIDDRKAVEELQRCTKLSPKQEFKLASMCCLKDQIPAVFKLLTQEDKKKIYDEEDPEKIKQPKLVKFWSYFAMGDIDKLKGDLSVDQYRLDMAIVSGSKVAVQYCVENTSIAKRKDCLIDAAVCVIKLRVQRDLRSRMPNSKTLTDWVVFRDKRYKCFEDLWVPSYCFADVLYYLLSKMTDDHKIEMLKKLFISVKTDKARLKSPPHTKVLEYFLYFPYQDEFMELARLSWRYLPMRSFGGMILETLDRIEPEKGQFFYGENKCYDYRNLMMELWCCSPQRYKRYAFCDKELTVNRLSDPRLKTCLTFNEGKELIFKLYQLRDFTLEDRKNIVLILNTATAEEKEGILYSEPGFRICMLLLKDEKVDLFDELISTCFPSPKRALHFRKKFSFVKVKDICLDFIRKNKWEEAEQSPQWCKLSKQEVKKLKKIMISCEEGKQTCRELSVSNVAIAETFVWWCFDSKDYIQSFKHELLTEDEGIQYCKDLIANGSLESVDKFIKWCLSSKEEIEEFKEQLAYKVGFSICENVLLGGSIREGQSDDAYDITNQDEKWTVAENFLSWCFPEKSEEAIFKRKILENSGDKIHFQFIKSKKFTDVELFFSWLALSSEEVKKMRKEKLFTCSSTSEMFDDLMSSKEDDERFAACGGRQKAIEQFLRWVLVDKEAVDEFKARFRCYNDDEVIKRLIPQLYEEFDNQTN